MTTKVQRRTSGGYYGPGRPVAYGTADSHASSSRILPGSPGVQHQRTTTDNPGTDAGSTACLPVEIGFLEVDPREFPAITRVFLAAGIWGLFGQHFPTGEDGGFYSCSGQASRTG